MHDYSNLSDDQIRDALTFLEENFSKAMDAEAFSLAQSLKDKINILFNELVKRIVAEDPYTTEADVRYFESAN